MIKQASKEEAEILSQMAIKIWNNDSIAELTNEFLSMMDDPDSACFIMFVNQKPVGFANASIRYDYVEGTESSPLGYLEGIFVEESHRKNNYGQELVEACQKWVKSKEIKEFASDCELSNLDSLTFHLAVGFSEANRIICFKKDI